MVFDIFGKVWLLDERYYDLTSKIILRRLEEGKPALDITEVKPKAGFEKAIKFAKAWGANAERNIAILPVSGTMLKSGDWCSYGTADMNAELQRLLNDPQIHGAVLQVDSPGGEVDGTETFGNTIKNSQKPIVTFVDGLAASAAYWIGSQSREMMASGKTAYVGSIGVLAVHINNQKAIEQRGQKVTIVRSDKATDKATFNSYEELTDETLIAQKKQLNYIHDQFISAVQSGRGDRLKGEENIFSGKVYHAEEAKKLGMIDSIGTLQDAIQRVASLRKAS